MIATHLSAALTVVGVLAGVTYAAAACLAARSGDDKRALSREEGAAGETRLSR